MFQRAYSSCRSSVSSPSRNAVTKYGRLSHRRWLETDSAMEDASYDPSWEDEALQHTFSSLRQGLSLPSKGVSSVHDEALRAASPLRSPTLGLSSPRFDWRRRATSRAPPRGNRHEVSRDGKNAEGHVKRLVPQQHEIRVGGRFHQEVKAYEDRWVLVSHPGGHHETFFLPDFYPC
jgi:hypothetical protein